MKFVIIRDNIKTLQIIFSIPILLLLFTFLVYFQNMKNCAKIYRYIDAEPDKDGYEAYINPGQYIYTATIKSNDQTIDAIRYLDLPGMPHYPNSDPGCFLEESATDFLVKDHCLIKGRVGGCE